MNSRIAFDETINELISKREEAIRIAHPYKSELGEIEISDENIQYQNSTVGRILEIL